MGDEIAAGIGTHIRHSNARERPSRASLLATSRVNRSLTLTPAPPSGLLLTNLLNGLPELAPLLREEVGRQSWLNAYLLACGIDQIVVDDMHAERPESRIARHLAEARSPLPRRVVDGLRAVADTAGGHRSGASRLLPWHLQFADLVELLARCAIGTSTRGERELVVSRTETLLPSREELPPHPGSSVLRLPACFHDFDQRPADIQRLVGRFARRDSDRGQPVLVVGVRTSGSYLAPLTAAYLAGEGYVDVTVLTVRPGTSLLPHEREVVRAAARARATVVVVDDPPLTGRSIASVLGQLRGLGLDGRRVVLLLQVFGSEGRLPSTLASYEAITLPWSDWAINASLTPGAVRAAVERLIGAEVVDAVGPRLLPRSPEPRGHCRALYRLELSDEHGGRALDLLVQGVGLGYFGEHAVAIAQKLDGRIPAVLGVSEGLLYREWLPERRRRTAEGALADGIAAYALARREALPVDRDASMTLAGRSVWEEASGCLAEAFGQNGRHLRRLALDHHVKAALRVARPSVIDGSCGLSNWFAGEDGRLMKTEATGSGLSNRGLACCDAVFDLAGAAASAPGSMLARRLRQSFEELDGEPIDPARWLLYHLVHLRALAETHPGERRSAVRGLSRALASFFEEVYFRDLTPGGDGPFCALDLDGVLETEVLGAPALTPSAALALRGLTLHGYRPLLVSGRSLSEVEERCRVYRLAGGVAENGGVAFDGGTGSRLVLLPEPARLDLERLRSTLMELEGVHVEPGYRYSVRAWQRPGRTALPGGVARAAIAAAGAFVRVLSADGYSDFVPTVVDRGTGLATLASRLGRDQPIAFAVGDTLADLPMLALADRSFAPAHAAGLAGTPGVERVRRPHQAGFALAVEELLGHRPGGCPLCQPPPRSRETAFVLDVLAAQERDQPGALATALRLALARA